MPIWAEDVTVTPNVVSCASWSDRFDACLFCRLFLLATRSRAWWVLCHLTACLNGLSRFVGNVFRGTAAEGQLLCLWAVGFDCSAQLLF